MEKGSFCVQCTLKTVLWALNQSPGHSRKFPFGMQHRDTSRKATGVQVRGHGEYLENLCDVLNPTNALI